MSETTKTSSQPWNFCLFFLRFHVFCSIHTDQTPVRRLKWTNKSLGSGWSNKGGSLGDSSRCSSCFIILFLLDDKAADILYFCYCQHVLSKYPNQQCVSQPCSEHGHQSAATSRPLKGEVNRNDSHPSLGGYIRQQVNPLSLKLMLKGLNERNFVKDSSCETFLLKSCPRKEDTVK